MPKYTPDIVAGYCLYFTSKCVVEAMHVHASDKELSEQNSAKLFVKENGDTVIETFVKSEKTFSELSLIEPVVVELIRREK